MRGLRISVLGPLDVIAGGAPVALPGRRQRELLAALALRVGRPASAEALAVSIYGDPLPKTATESVRMHVTALRRAVAKADPGLDMALRTSSLGYVLDTALTQTDLIDAERLVDAAEQAARAGDAVNALREAEKAADLWRGEPLREFDSTPFGVQSSPALHALHARCLKILASAALSFGPAELESALTRLSTRRDWHPWDETLVALIAHCQYRAGRQEAALRTLTQYRDALVDELGLDPSPELVVLHNRILTQDPVLETPVIRRTAGPVGRVVGRESELSAVIKAVSDPSVRLVIVGGPAGIGKSTVLDEVAQRCAALTVRPRADDGPYDALRRAFRMRATDATSSTRGVFGEVRPSHTLVVNPLLHHLRSGPDVVVIDDADHLDDGSVSILQKVVTDDTVPLTVVMGSRRPGTMLTAWVATGADLRVVHLQDLEDTTVRDIANHHAPNLSAAQTADLVRRAAGNPGRLLELVTVAGSHTRGTANTSGLNGDIRRVVQAVGVLAPLSTTELAAVLGISAVEVGSAVRAAAELGLLTNDEDTLRVADSTSAREAGAGVVDDQRARLHAAMAAYLGTSIRHGDAVRRGQHLLCCDELPGEQVVSDGVLAATRSAITLGWFDTARALVEAGLRRPGCDTAQELALRLERARISIAGDDTATANEELREVFRRSAELGLADLASSSLLTLQTLGVTVGGDGFLLTSWQWLTEHLLPEPGEVRTKAYCGAAYAALTGEQPELAATMLDRAEKNRVLTPTEEAMVSHARLLTSRTAPDPDGVARTQLARLQQAALLRSEPEIEVRMRLDRVIVALDGGDVDTAASSLRGMSEMADELGHPQGRWISRAAAASVALCTGDYSLAAARSIEAAEIGTALGVPETVISGAAFQLALHERNGQLPQLRPLLEAMSDPPDTIAVAWHSGAALAALAVDDLDGASRHWARIQDRAKVFRPSLLAVPGDYLAADAASAVGDFETAQILAARLAPIADRFVVVGSAVAVFGPVARVLALVAQRCGDPVRAAQMWELNDRLCSRGALAWHTSTRP